MTDLPEPLEDKKDINLLLDCKYDYTFKYKIAQQASIPLEKNLSSSLFLDKDINFSRLAAGGANSPIHIFDINNNCRILHKIPRISTISSCYYNQMLCGIRFLDNNGNCLLVGYNGGYIKTFDFRISDTNSQFTLHLPNNDKKNSELICCFDRNANSSTLCVGTERMRDFVKVVFYDLRKMKAIFQFGSPYNSDMASIQFHPNNPNQLIAGGIDGIIDIFDISYPDDDISLEVIETQSSIYRINWHNYLSGNDIISCITQCNDYMLYNTKGNLIAKYKYSDITSKFEWKVKHNVNIINAHNGTKLNEIYLILSIKSSDSNEMRLLVWREGNLLPMATFINNTQEPSDSLYIEKYSLVVTGSENGIITIWKPDILKDCPY